ncbi:MAG: YraN family protein, partial [Candidatus Omnitrophota bacterium]
MPENNRSLGRSAEDCAAELLKKNAYKILARNYRTKLGEIDIVALDKDTICFVEVKMRRTERFGSPLDSISRFKQRQISKAALIYLKKNKLLNKKARFDVVSMIYLKNSPQINLIKNAF